MEAQDIQNLRAAFARASVAHLVIDMQQTYCNDIARAGLEKHTSQRLSGLVQDVATYAAHMRDKMQPVWIAHTNWLTCTGLEENPQDKTKKSCVRRMLDIFTSVARRATPAYYSAEQIAARRSARGRRELYKMPVQDHDPVVGKPSYDGFADTPLDRVLRQRGIDTVVLSGIFADQCVFETANSALDRGYKVVVLDDLTMPGIDYTGGKMGYLEDRGAVITHGRSLWNL